MTEPTAQEQLRRIIRGKLTKQTRREMGQIVIRSSLWETDQGFIELCNFVLYASKKALRIRFMH